MNDYNWNNLRNAIGWAAECARLALAFHQGDHRSLVFAIKVANGYAAGKTVSYTAAADALGRAHATLAGSAGVAYAAASAAAGAVEATIYAADLATYTTAAAAATAGHVAASAAHAGVGQDAIDLAHWRWIVRDIAGGRYLGKIHQRAAVAAVAAGRVELAKDIISHTQLSKT